MRDSKSSGIWSPAMRLWARTELGRRWRQLVLLGVMVGITCGLALAAVDGAARTGTALDRFLERTSASEVVVFPAQGGVFDPEWTAMRAEPAVERLAVWGLLFGTFDGEFQPNSPLFVPVDGGMTTTIDRLIVLRGRLATAPNEIVIHDSDIAVTGWDLGDTIHFQAMAPTDQFDGQVHGPTTDFVVVGIVRSPWQVLFTGGGGFVSPAYASEYAGQASILENAVLDVRDGTSEADIRALVGRTVQPGVPVLDLRSVARRAQTSLDVEQAILIAIGIAITTVGAVLIGQAVVRSSTDAAADAPTLRSMGMTTTELVAAPTLAHALASAVAVPIAVATALITSRWLPVGFGAQLDLDRGVQASVLFSLVSAVAVAVVVLVVSAIAARASLVQRSAGTRQGFLAGLTRGVRPLSARLGCVMALEPRVGRRSTGSRAALLGAVAALVGVAGGITLTRGVSDAADHPERAGVIWDAELAPFPNESGEIGAPDWLEAQLRQQPEVTGAVAVLRVPFDINGVAVPMFALDETMIGDDPFHFTLTEGRLPATDDEVALGPATASLLDVGIGDEVTLQDGLAATVVGLTLFPTDVHSRFDEGATVSWNRELALLAQSEVGVGDTSLIVALRLSSGPDQQVIDRIGAALDQPIQDLIAAAEPPEIGNLAQIRTLPLVVALFLLLLGVFAVGYGLTSSVRRRRREIAVWRALGMSTGGTRLAIVAQATTIAIVGTAVGVPLGIVLGRLSWKAISDRIPLAFVAPLAAGAIAIAVMVAFLLANALAILPGRHAARIRPAVVLRTE